MPFPPRKMLRPDEPQYSSSHSPLSPLTQSSPLHPDGLIAPIWIRKHTTLVPSVFVVFMRIYESPAPAPGQEQDQKEREAEEKKRDAELAAEISQRKKTTNERNIKLTAVLIASRRMLGEHPLFHISLIPLDLDNHRVWSRLNAVERSGVEKGTMPGTICAHIPA